MSIGTDTLALNWNWQLPDGKWNQPMRQQPITDIQLIGFEQHRYLIITVAKSSTEQNTQIHRELYVAKSFPAVLAHCAANLRQRKETDISDKANHVKK